MKCILLSIFLNLLAIQGMTQVEKPEYKPIAGRLERLYNQGNYDSIFNMFSPEMQKALPLDKTKVFFGGLKTQAGQITKRSFSGYENGSYASYKTNFERALFALNISVDNNDMINGLLVKPYKPINLPKPEKNVTKLSLPFKEAWNVVWGGDTKALNYHVESEAQKNAFDLVILDKSGKSYKTDGKSNEDYYAFGKPIVAPCDGEVVLVVDGVKDNIVGEMNPFNTGGNMIILKTVNNEYLVFCHFKHQSIKAREGQQISQGEILGLCGNSGNSSEPHLHFSYSECGEYK